MDNSTEGGRLRDAGMKVAEEAQAERDPLTKQKAISEIRWMAENFETFTSDDVHFFSAIRTDHPCAWGSYYKEAHKLGLMEIAVGIPYVKSKRPSAHAAAIPVYRSLIYKGAHEPAE